MLPLCCYCCRCECVFNVAVVLLLLPLWVCVFSVAVVLLLLLLWACVFNVAVVLLLLPL